MRVIDFFNGNNPVFYHITLTENRDSILTRGLKLDYEKSPDGGKRGIYVCVNNDSVLLSTIAESQKGWSQGGEVLLVSIDPTRNMITWEDIAPDLHTDEACAYACKITKDVSNIQEADMSIFVVGNSDMSQYSSEKLTHFHIKHRPALYEIICPEIQWVE